MPTTRDRFWFATLAIETWLQNRREPEDELVIISEHLDVRGLLGLDVSGGLPGGEQIRFVESPKSALFTEKRNLGVQACKNPWVVFWDDDDFHGYHRLDVLRTVMRANPEAQIVGQTEMYYLDLLTIDEPGTVPPTPRAFLYSYPESAQLENPYVAGGPMTFQKALWERKKFTTHATGGDEGWWTVELLRDERVPYARFDKALSPYVAMIHSRNTSAQPPRVRGNRVVSDSYMKIVEMTEIFRALPPAMYARYLAAAYAQSGEQE